MVQDEVCNLCRSAYWSRFAKLGCMMGEITNRPVGHSLHLLFSLVSRAVLRALKRIQGMFNLTNMSPGLEPDSATSCHPAAQISNTSEVHDSMCRFHCLTMNNSKSDEAVHSILKSCVY